MVGAANARFYMEGYSVQYASGILKKVWSIANRAGFSEYFVFDQVGYIDDDHKYINEIAKIPTINIIHLDPESSNGSFFEYWHTAGDNLSVIDKQTLKCGWANFAQCDFRGKIIHQFFNRVFLPHRIIGT